ncbi:MAG: ribonuclease Z [Bacteroidales bacterium]|nr:ribonuclease Z [Bacteroidales bacterium]
MTFSVTILGSSSALPTSKRFPTAHLFNSNERFFLIDCGEGTQIQLRKFHLRFGKINHIFISHLHGDHYFGLYGLISTFSLMGRKIPLHIYAHSELEKLLNCQFADNNLGFNILFHTIPKEKSLVLYEDKNITVSTFPLKHRLPANGFLFKEKQKPLNIRKEMIQKFQLGLKEIHSIKSGEDFQTKDNQIIPNIDLTLPPYKRRAYAFCSDTAYYPDIVKYIKNVDILYHEATFAEDNKDIAMETGHSTAKQAAQIAKLAGVGKLLIGHFSSRYKNVKILETEAKEIFKSSEAVTEGKEYKIDLVREKRND